jgi:predicted dehydrogenase
MKNIGAYVLVLGLGSIGLRHARNLRHLGVEVVGFDPALQRQELARAEGIALTRDRAGALNSASAVVIATPSQCHFDDLLDAVQSGKPAFVEKPIATTLRGVPELIATAKAPIFPALILRHDPTVQAAREFLRSLGASTNVDGVVRCTSYLPDWRPGTNYKTGYAADPVSGGVIFDHIHEIDLSWHLLGPLKLVKATANIADTLGLVSEGSAELDFDHRSGQVRVEVDYGAPGNSRRETLLKGPWGCLMLDVIQRRLLIWGPTGQRISDRQFFGDYLEDYIDQMKQFLDVVAGKAEPSCTVAEALDVLKLVVAARKACHLPMA